jgi:hypothetical protein
MSYQITISLNEIKLSLSSLPKTNTLSLGPLKIRGWENLRYNRDPTKV